MFFTVGRKDGICDHEHDSFLEAQKCLTQHQNEMRAKGKVSDRQIVESSSREELEDDLELY